MDASHDHQLSILLVDDNETILKAIGCLLRVIGHSVAEARCVREALSLLEYQTVDLLISDVNLGNGSGLELIQRVRQTSEIPAIAMSGQSDMSEPCLAGGFSAFLDKPVSRQRLQQTIRLLVSGSPIPERNSQAFLSVNDLARATFSGLDTEILTIQS